MAGPPPDPHETCVEERGHEHVFGQDVRREGERRTRIVIVLTAVTMVAEIVAGLVFGSMALLADGLHMASHAMALGISAFAYAYARRHAADVRFSFGTGKVNALAGYTGAVLLAVFALFMAVESIGRFFAPVTIHFDQAILVAVLGLAVNAVSAWILGGGHGHDHDHAHAHPHGHAHHHDHNLRSAYLHVLADALTSIAAILALLAGKFLGWGWMDPAMGIVGSLLIARWSVQLLRESSRTLLDRQAPEGLRESVRKAIEGDTTDRVMDLHLWSIGPGIWAAEIAVLAEAPEPPDAYKARLPDDLGIVHATMEVLPCAHDPS
jgi:cation diffusion facilitator family transporter